MGGDCDSQPWWVTSEQWQWQHLFMSVKQLRCAFAIKIAVLLEGGVDLGFYAVDQGSGDGPSVDFLAEEFTEGFFFLQLGQVFGRVAHIGEEFT